LFSVLLGSCGGGPAPEPVIAEAYAGPPSLQLRSDIPSRSSVAATVNHGDRVEIIGRRRRFMKVRTSAGREGWTHERNLLAPEEMAGLRRLAEQAKSLPAQGKGTTYGDLNVHTQPSRQAPTFHQMKEGEKVTVLMHQYLPREEFERPPLIPPTPETPKAVRKPPKEPKYPPPPMPDPPAPPENWLELSKTEFEVAEEEPEDEPAREAVPFDSWSLVQTAAGKAGWVLTRRLVMAIPDEVAQYAEGKRIVSYFSLGEVTDGAEKKHHWLWTTMGSGPAPYAFDSFRVFIWNTRRHRYETAYIERSIKGYGPVKVHDVELEGTRNAVKYPGFSLCVEKQDGQRYRREYAFIVNIVRFAGERPCEGPRELLQPEPAEPSHVAERPEPAEEPFEERFKKRLRAITRGWFGG
jgi:hypothetical protein